MKKWTRKNIKEVLKAKVFKYKTVESSSADKSMSGVFDIVECRDWVNVVAISEKQELILVKQYRHGIDDISLEVPAGVIDPGEEPIEAAKRELQEECGASSSHWIDLGSSKVNPAFMTNTCYFFLALDCRFDKQQSFDPLEDIELELVAKDEVEALLASKIDHSLCALALHKYMAKKPS